MKIYSILGVQIANVPVQSNAEHERELMKSDFIRLEWSQSSFLELPCGSYVEYDGIKYRLLKDYKPEQQSTQQWDYSPEFQHPVMMLGTIPFILVTGDTTSWQSADKETEWSWTGMAVNAINEVFVPFLNKFGADNADIGTGWTAVVSTDIKASETLTFQSMDFLSALSYAAQQFECEWHLDYENKILYFGHININTEELIFEVGKNVGNPEVRENNEGYYNAYIAKGSTRNISQVNDKGENIQLNKRLKLDPVKYPDGYIDRRKSVKEPLIIKELIYEDIYPSLDLYIYNPKARTRFLLDPNTGKKIEDDTDPTGYKRYSIWYVRLAYKLNGKWKDFEFSKDMLIGNLSCQFQGNENSTKYTSPLAGLEFELTYHDSDQIIPADPVTGDTGITIKKGDYEIIYDENNGLIIPTTVEGGMYPRGDEYQSEDNNILRLYNIALPSEYTSKAQEELETQALKDIAYWESDRNNYEFNSNPIAFKSDMPNLFIGRGVVYKNGGYELKTRISKLVQKIDFPYEVEITVGNEEIKGSTTTMREQLQMVVSAMSNGMGGMSVEQFKKMLNIYGISIFGSRFLSKLNPDTAAGLITFLKGLVADGIITAKQGVEFGEYMTGLVGRGGKIDALGHGELRSLTLHEWLEVPEIRFNRITVNIGLSIRSEGGGIIQEVVPDVYEDGTFAPMGSAWLKLEDGEYGAIALNDLNMGIWHDFGGGNATENADDKKGTITKRGFKTVYFRITDIPATDPDGKDNSDHHFFRYALRSVEDGGNNSHPCAQMHFAQRGNTDDTERQGLLLSTTKYDIRLAGVNSWYFQDNQIYMIEGELEGFSMQQIGSDGNTYTKHFHGSGLVFGNAYMFGKMDEFERAGYRMEITRSGDGRITSASPENITIRIINAYGVNVTSRFTTFKLTRDSGDPEADAEWNKQHESVATEFTMSAAALGTMAYIQPILFTVTASAEGLQDVSASFTERYVSTEELHIEFQPIEGKSYVVKASNVDTIVEARLYFGQQDITDDILLRSSSIMKWTRDSGIPTEDAAWTATTGETPNIIHIVDRIDDRHDCGSYWSEKLKVMFTFECTVVFAVETVTLSATVGIGN